MAFRENYSREMHSRKENFFPQLASERYAKRPVSQEKYIGMDVHQATISVAVRDAHGKLIMECVLETKAGTILEFMQGLSGTLALTFEEGTSAAWLHDLLNPMSAGWWSDPRKNALIKDGNKNDRVDARNLAELLRSNQVKPEYHGKHGTRALKELGRSYYECLHFPSSRRLAGPAGGSRVRIRAEHLYQQLDSLQPVRVEARRQLLLESRKHAVQAC